VSIRRYEALAKSTWWLWALFLGLGLPGGVLLHGGLFAMLPISAITFLWFAHVRFDAQGKRRELGHGRPRGED